MAEYSVIEHGESLRTKIYEKRDIDPLIIEKLHGCSDVRFLKDVICYKIAYNLQVGRLDNVPFIGEQWGKYGNIPYIFATREEISSLLKSDTCVFVEGIGEIHRLEDLEADFTIEIQDFRSKRHFRLKNNNLLFFGTLIEWILSTLSVNT